MRFARQLRDDWFKGFVCRVFGDLPHIVVVFFGDYRPLGKYEGNETGAVDGVKNFL